MLILSRPQLQKELDINFRLSVSSSEEKPKKKTKKSTKVLLLLTKLINSVYLVDKDNICLHSSDKSCLLPQKTLRQNEPTSPSLPKHKKMPFVAGTVRQFLCSALTKNHILLTVSLFLIPFDCFFYLPLPVTVNKPKPFSPRQHTKYTPHDETPSAPTVRTSERSAKIWMRSQEKPPKGFLSIFHHFAQTWQGAWKIRSVTGLAFWSALGSAGRARTNELVSQLFYLLFYLTFLFLFYTFSFLFLCCFCVSEHQELVGQIDATQHPEQRKDLQRELERLVTRMEEKGAQITKLRKHQQTVRKPPLGTIQRHLCKDQFLIL